MSERCGLAAIVSADLKIRFRRPSRITVFLLLSAFAYVWVPDPATGRAILQIDGKRALYNSAAIGMATATPASSPKGVMPFAFAAAAILIADIASRERRVGTLPLVYSTPHLRERFVWWKFGSAFLLGGAVLLRSQRGSGLQSAVFIRSEYSHNKNCRLKT